MPVVSVGRDDLFKVLGKEYTKDEFEVVCFDFGVELDDVCVEEDEATGASKVVYKIDIPANRYDLLCLEGIGRAMNVFFNGTAPPTYSVVPQSEPQNTMTVEPSTNAVRPFVVCAILRGVSIRQMVAADPANFALALEAKDAAPIAAAGKRVVYMSIENAYPLGEDVSLLQTFYDMGVRVVGFAHFAHNQFADSSTDPSKKPRYGGLSPLGKELLKEMNRLGVVPDASHSSDQVLDDLLALSTTPVLLTHSGCKAIYDHPRNIDDDHLKALAAKGGVIQMNAYGSYLKASKPNPERQKAMGALFASLREGGTITAEKRAELLARRQEIDRLYPETDRATFDDFMTHMLHALKVVGPDHVGIGADWDGGGGVVGMEDVVDLPRITDALLKAGYSEADVQKIWSGNVLRVLAAAEAKKGK